MSGYQDCREGNCNPWTCLVCAQACGGCGDLDYCTCPTLPIDTEDDE